MGNVNAHYGLHSGRAHHQVVNMTQRKNSHFSNYNKSRPPNPHHYSSRSAQTSKTSYQSLTSRSNLERHQIQNILKPGDTRQNCQLTLMGILLKRNRHKTRIFNSYGKNLRFFVLDFQCQKFYYKENMASQNIKFICAFSQILGVYNFLVSRMPDGSQTDKMDVGSNAEIPYSDKNVKDSRGSITDSDINRYQSSRLIEKLTEKELEMERQHKWNYGLEIYFSQKENKDRQELFVIYFNSKKQQDMWIDRFDRIIASNKS